jgi:hypothetical protein
MGRHGARGNRAIVSSFVASARALVRPASLSVMLVVGLHLGIGVLALRAMVHPAALPARGRAAIQITSVMAGVVLDTIRSPVEPMSAIRVWIERYKG